MRRLLIALVMLQSLLVACGSSGNGTGGGNGPVQTADHLLAPGTSGDSLPDGFVDVEFLVVNNMTHLAPFVALELGLWADRGLNVNLRVLSSGADIGAALASGQADLGAVNGGTGVAPQRAAGLQTKLIAPYNSDALDMKYVDWIGMVGRRDAGITTEPDSLIGKRIGVTAGGTARAYLTEWLLRNEIDETDITLVPMAAPEMLTAIVNGDVDLVLPTEPFRSSALRQLGNNGVDVSPGESLVLSTIGLGATDGQVAADPELFRAVIEGIVEAMYIIRQDPGRVAPTVLNFVDGISEEDALAAVARNSYDPRISVCLRRGVELTAQQLVDAGRFEVERPFTSDDLLDADLLDQVLGDHPEWIADLPPLPETVEACDGYDS